MSLSELYPVPVYARIDDSIVFELRPFDLRAVAWTESFFSTPTQRGTDAMNAALSNPGDFPTYADTVADIIYYLKKDNDLGDYFNINSPCEFKAKIRNKKESEGGPERAIAYLNMSLSQVFFDSFPEPKGDEKTGVVNHSQDEPVKTNWSGIYADFYRAGGISLDEFSKMTLKQVDLIYPEIMSRISTDFKNMADLHGRKIQNGFSHKKKKTEFSKEDIALLENDIARFNSTIENGN